MIKKTFGELVPGQSFSWGGTRFVKTLPYKAGNSVELNTTYAVWGAFFDDVMVETEDVATEPKGFITEPSLEEELNFEKRAASRIIERPTILEELEQSLQQTPEEW